MPLSGYYSGGNSVADAAFVAVGEPTRRSVAVRGPTTRVRIDVTKPW